MSTRSFRPDLATGLYPEDLFLELLEREVARSRRYARPLSVLMGCPGGEIALDLEVMTLGWMSLARDVDFGARLDGGRWVMALPETGRAGASVAAERFRRGLDALLADSGGSLALGVVSHPYHGGSAVALLEAAARLLGETGPSTAIAEFPQERQPG